MKRMNRNDRILLEALDDKYGKDLLASALIQIANGQMCDGEECCEGQCSPPEAVLDYIKYLEGARIRLREIHWETTSNSIHSLTDDYISKLENFEDEIAEDFMGVCGVHIKVGQIVPDITEQTTVDGLMEELMNKTLDLIASIEGDKKYTGIKNVLEEICHVLGQGAFKDDLK